MAAAPPECPINTILCPRNLFRINDSSAEAHSITAFIGISFCPIRKIVLLTNSRCARIQQLFIDDSTFAVALPIERPCLPDSVLIFMLL